MEKIILTNMCLIENSTTKEVVIIHRIKNWCGIAFPGGHIEEGEAIVPSVIREVKEETSLDITNLKFCGIRNWYDPTINERNIVFMFKTNTFYGTLNRVSNEGLLEWKRLDEIKKEDFASGLYDELKIFDDEAINEYYSIYDKTKDVWKNTKF